jgi:hypothetical protein
MYKFVDRKEVEGIWGATVSFLILVAEFIDPWLGDKVNSGIHCKNVRGFPVSRRDVTNYSRPWRVWLVTSRQKLAKLVTFFYSVWLSYLLASPCSLAGRYDNPMVGVDFISPSQDLWIRLQVWRAEEGRPKNIYYIENSPKIPASESYLVKDSAAAWGYFWGHLPPLVLFSRWTCSVGF